MVFERSQVNLDNGLVGFKKMKCFVILECDQETGDWAVWCPELPGCVSCGETEETALTNILEAIELYLEPN